MKNKAEITWSLSHPTELNADYMRRVLAESKRYRVDSLEICGSCNSNIGGLDGFLLFEQYSRTRQLVNHSAVLKNRERMREIVSLAHTSGLPCLYWHREVTLCDGLLEDVPELMDRNGEFDVLGNAFEELMRYKIINALDAIPEIDGIVLTLTESDFAVIHNSDREKYPPVKVVEKIVGVFSETLSKLNKRFILRSFGSIKQDYEDILAGAELAVAERQFEIETKSTAYDFIPFLPLNPFLHAIPGSTISIECDSIGEFLGAGYLPAENVDKVVEYVRGGLQRGVSRFVIRIDRIGNNIFDTHEINLFAFQQAIDAADATADGIRKQWWQQTCPDCSSEMRQLAIQSGEMVRKLHFIDGSVIFHMFPVEGDFKWIKAGGILSVFKNGVSLRNMADVWGIRFEQSTPGRDKIIAEKEQAVELAVDGLKTLHALKNKLPEKQFRQTEKLWMNACTAARAILAFCKCIRVYFDAMENASGECPELDREIASATAELNSLLTEPRYAATASDPHAFSNGMDRRIYRCSDNNLDNIYVHPLLELVRKMKVEYTAELSLRRRLKAQDNPVDLVVCGGFLDDWRVRRYMHGSHAVLHNGLVARFAGNRVFPNGFIEIDLHIPENTDAEIKIYAAPEITGKLTATTNGAKQHCLLDKDGCCRVQTRGLNKASVLRIEKNGAEYPLIYAVTLVLL